MDGQKELTLEDVVAQMKVMQATINTQAEHIVALKGKVAETSLNDAKQQVPTIPKENVERGDKEYAWQLAVFVLPGHGKVTAEEATLSDDIIDQILAVPGQGILKELA